MPRQKGTPNRPKGLFPQEQQNMVTSEVAYNLATTFRNEAELYKSKFEKLQCECEYYKALAEAITTVIEISEECGFVTFEAYGERSDEWSKAYKKWQQLKQPPEQR